MLLFLSARGILRIHSDPENFCFQGSSSSSFPISTSARDSQLVRCHHQLVQHLDSEFSFLRAHHSAILVSRLLSSVHIVGLCGFHFSIRVEREDVVFEKDWNEFVLSMPVHQFLKMNSHSLTNFAVNRNHVTTVMSQVEILSSFASDLCSGAHHFVCTSESSIQRSEQSAFVVPLKLPSSTIWNPFTTGSPIESSISCSIWTKVQWECVHCSSFVQVHLHPSKTLRTTRGTKIQTSKWKWACRSVIRLFPASVPSNGSPVIIPFIKTPAIVPFVKTPSIMNP